MNLITTLGTKTNMSKHKVLHLAYVPFTGLGRYNGFRGNDWLQNRIKVFKQYVIPSLQNQTNQDFVVWISWRQEEKGNPQVMALENYILEHTNLRLIMTYGGVCFWDDKYPDEEAQARLKLSLHRSLVDIMNQFGSYKTVLMTIQPSDDCYDQKAYEEFRRVLMTTDAEVAGYRKGYVARYTTGEIAEYNPDTTPPFFTIKFPYEVFVDTMKHYTYTGPYKSHEYIGDKLKYVGLEGRGFLVGTHGENISTTFDIPYKGQDVPKEVFNQFGIKPNPIKLRLNIRRTVMSKLPYAVRRKLRYWFGEKLPVFKWIVQ